MCHLYFIAIEVCHITLASMHFYMFHNRLFHLISIHPLRIWMTINTKCPGGSKINFNDWKGVILCKFDWVKASLIMASIRGMLYLFHRQF